MRQGWSGWGGGKRRGDKRGRNRLSRFRHYIRRCWRINNTHLPTGGQKNKQGKENKFHAPSLSQLLSLWFMGNVEVRAIASCFTEFIAFAVNPRQNRL